MNTTSKRQLIITLADQTGDTMHVAGALALDSNTDALVLFKGGAEEADALLQFYRKAAASNVGDLIPRVRFYSTSQYAEFNARDVYNNLTSQDEADHTRDVEWAVVGGKRFNDKAKRLGWSPDTLKTFAGVCLTYKVSQDSPSLAYTTLTVVGATYLIANIFEQNVKNVATCYEQIVQRLANVPLLSDPSLVSIIKDGRFKDVQLPPSNGKPILLLWARYTGQNSDEGYNPAGDSDVGGQRQLLDLAQDMGFQVITIGHDPAVARNEPGVYAPCHLGEFYRHDPISGAGRAGQLSFFLALMQRYPGKIVQMGQKTGGMDAAAQVGMPTLYIEDINSPTIKRMAKWTNGAIPGYRSAITELPPTSLGKAIRILNKALEVGGIRANLLSKQYRTLAMLYALKTQLGDAQLNVELPNLVTFAQGLSDVDMLAWKLKIQAMSVDQMKAGNVSKGYIDLAPIHDALVDVQKSLMDSDAIVRNGEGKYIPRGKL